MHSTFVMADAVNVVRIHHNTILRSAAGCPGTAGNPQTPWHLVELRPRKRDRATLPDFGALRDALVARCPALGSLWFDGDDFVYRWCKDVNGIVVEATTVNFGDARPR
ncbi:hypothetical protein FB451DRAFT_1376026, partial [Mycena latifolia]